MTVRNILSSQRKKFDLRNTKKKEMRPPSESKTHICNIFVKSVL